MESRGASSTYCAENTEPRWRQKESERARDPRLLQKEAGLPEGGTNMRFRVRRAGLLFLWRAEQLFSGHGGGTG